MISGYTLGSKYDKSKRCCLCDLDSNIIPFFLREIYIDDNLDNICITEISIDKLSMFCFLSRYCFLITSSSYLPKSNKYIQDLNSISNYTFELHVLHIIHCSWSIILSYIRIKAVQLSHYSFFGWYYPSELVLLPQSLLFHN